MVEHPPAVGNRTRRTMKRMLLVFVAVLAFASLQANTPVERIKAVGSPFVSEIQGTEYPLWSGYIKNFYSDDRYYITYQEEGSRQMVLYCTQSVFKSLRDDYAVMIEAAVKVRRGEFDYASLVILESVFQEKYTYSRRSNGEWWITKH